MHMEHGLGRVEADADNVCHGWLLTVAFGIPTMARRCLQGAIHPIKAGASQLQAVRLRQKLRRQVQKFTGGIQQEVG